MMNRKKADANNYKAPSKHQSTHRAKKGNTTAPIIKALCAGIICAFLFGGFYTSAQNNRIEEPENYKYYKSITIESGDSLWSLAEEYMTDDYDSIDEYVQVLKTINNLHEDKILAGQKIIVAYNDTEFIGITY